MIARITLLAVTGFWVTMNVLLWRAEYGANSEDYPVPLQLVWHKILTAPDASSLSVYQNRERMGYCEFSTSVGQQMATLDEDRPPPEGIVARAGYQIHLAGNVALGDFTNRIKFDGRVQFDAKREWPEIQFRVNSRLGVVEVHSVATNGTVHLRLMSDGTMSERDLTFEQLKNPNALVRILLGNVADLFAFDLDLGGLSGPAVQSLEWQARRTRIPIGTEMVPVYRLESHFLGRDLIVDVSTLGEVLQVRVPGEFTARIDELNRP